MNSRSKFRIPRARNPFTSSAPGSEPDCGFTCVEVLDALPPQEKEVVILSSFYGLAKDEIAGVVGASVGAVDALLTQAMEHLRRLLNPPQQGALPA